MNLNEISDWFAHFIQLPDWSIQPFRQLMNMHSASISCLIGGFIPAINQTNQTEVEFRYSTEVGFVD